MKSIIIIGSGHAGYTLARELRKLDKTTPLLVVTADDGGAYSKPMLSNAFAQGRQAAQLVTQNAAQMAAQLGAVVMTGTRVTAIDTENRKIETSGGVFEYGKLVLAVGAQPIRLPLQGDAADSVMSVNHVDDYARFRSRLTARESANARVAILGAGLIGCEFADDLAGAGHAVTLIDPNSLPLAALAPPALSQGLKAALGARGVTLRLGTTAARVDHRADALQLTLADGSKVDADVVLSAVGLRADLRLAQAAQLATGRGIAVDGYGQTSAPDVYALGDCAEYIDHADGSRRTLPYIAPLMAAARSIARTLTGQATRIELKAAPVIVKTPSYPLALLPAPAALNATGIWRTAEADGRTICRFHDSSGVLLGFGVAPHDAGVRQTLLAELGTSLDVAA
jgi:rubredoxin---NAD+ reductase